MNFLQKIKKIGCKKNVNFSPDISFALTKNSYQKILAFTQLPRCYYTITKGVAVKMSSHGEEQPLKTVTKIKLCLYKTISLCLTTFICL